MINLFPKDAIAFVDGLEPGVPTKMGSAYAQRMQGNASEA